mgnify:CR=1 FL=1
MKGKTIFFTALLDNESHKSPVTIMVTDLTDFIMATNHWLVWVHPTDGHSVHIEKSRLSNIALASE